MGKHLERAVRAEDVGMPDYRRNRVPGGTFVFTTSAGPVDLARGRRRYFRAYARNQGRLYPTDCTARGTDDRDFAATGKRHLAAAILGTHDQVRTGLCGPHRLHPSQPGEAWFGQGGAGLEHSSFRRCVAAGLYPLEWDGTQGDAIYDGERE